MKNYRTLVIDCCYNCRFSNYDDDLEMICTHEMDAHKKFVEPTGLCDNYQPDEYNGN
jgi:hypothetical protein